MLNKEEKAQVMLSICNVNVDNVLSHMKEAVSNGTSQKKVLKCFGHAYKALSRWYLNCCVLLLHCTNVKGKDKYTKFQLEWHQCCSVFLLPP